MAQSGFFGQRVLIALLFCAGAACSLLAGTLLAFFRPDAATKVSSGTLTFEERVSYQRAIEDVYWRHRMWPKERPDPKPSLDAVMSQAQLEKKVADYLRNSQALEDYWQRPITAEQLQSEMARMAKRTRQPDVLRELFEALGNDPFVIAECLARPALSERLLTNWYAYDQRIHGELKGRAEADLHAHPTVEAMKQTSGNYSEVELVRSDSAHEAGNRGAERGVKLNSREWDEALQKLAAIFGNGHPVAASVPPVQPTRLPSQKSPVAGTVSPAKGARITQMKIGILSPLQEDQERYYVTALIEQTDDHLRVASVSWLKEPLESWLARAENKTPNAIAAATTSYSLPTTSDQGNGCIDDTWTATVVDTPAGRANHTAVWTGSEMIIWGGGPLAEVLNTGGKYNPAMDTWTSTSITNAPSARLTHTAIWTGTEMIVWGGSNLNDTQYFNTGGRYNPSTDAWTATSTTNAPSGRASHTAVWTGAEMIVWGGYGAGAFNTGGRYNPSTDSWIATSTSNAPPSRFYHTAVWTGTEMIVWGGNGNGFVVNTGGKYNPSTDSWTAISPTSAPTARASHTAVWTGSEMIVWGGYDFLNNNYFDTGGRYNPSADSWTATNTTNAPTARILHTAVWTGSEMIVWGGYFYDGAVHYLNTGGKYNPGIDRWTATSANNAPSGRDSHTAVWTGSEMIAWGGVQSGNTGGRYNPALDSWVPTANLISDRASHTAVWTGSEMIVWGGGGGSYLNTGGRYNPSTDSWTATSIVNAPTGRVLHTAVWTGDEMIIWGGVRQSEPLNTGGRYNPAANSWAATSTTNAPSARYDHTAVWTGSEMIIWGGGSSNTGGRYNPGADSWIATSTVNAPSGRAYFAAVWTGSEMIVWGGISNGFVVNTGGRYNPSTNNWVATSPTNAPTGRESHTAIWSGSEMIIWGGYDSLSNNYFDSGGRYNPSADSWTVTNTTNAPDARSGHTAVWTGSEMIVWGGDFGDGSDFFYLNSGGRYNPVTDNWMATSTVNAPAGRYLHTAVRTDNEMIVWGGADGSSTLNSGGRYCAQSATPTPTSTPTPTATPRPTPTPRLRPTPWPRRSPPR